MLFFNSLCILTFGTFSFSLPMQKYVRHLYFMMAQNSFVNVDYASSLIFRDPSLQLPRSGVVLVPEDDGADEVSDGVEDGKDLEIRNKLFICMYS